MKVYSKTVTTARNVGVVSFWVTSFDYVGNENASSAPKVDIDTDVIAPTITADWVISSKGAVPDGMPEETKNSFAIIDETEF